VSERKRTSLAITKHLAAHLHFVPSVLCRLASLLLKIELRQLFLARLIDVINDFFSLIDGIVMRLIEIAARLVQFLISPERNRGCPIAQLLFAIDHIFLPDLAV